MIATHEHTQELFGLPGQPTSFAPPKPGSDFLAYAKPLSSERPQTKASPFQEELERRMSESRKPVKDSEPGQESSPQKNSSRYETKHSDEAKHSEIKTKKETTEKEHSEGKKVNKKTRRDREDSAKEGDARKLHSNKEQATNKINKELITFIKEGHEKSLNQKPGKDFSKKLSSEKLINQILSEQGEVAQTRLSKKSTDKWAHGKTVKNDLSDLLQKDAKLKKQVKTDETLSPLSRETQKEADAKTARHTKSGHGLEAALKKWEIKDERPSKEKSDVSVSKFALESFETEAIRNDKNTASHKHKRDNSDSGAQSSLPRNEVFLKDSAGLSESTFDPSRLGEAKTDAQFRARNQEAFDRLIQRAKVNIRADGSSRASIRLNPRLLGNLTLHIKLDENVMRGQVFVENRSAHKLIKQELEFLKQELHRQGIQVESLQIRIREPSQSQFSFEENANPESRFFGGMDGNFDGQTDDRGLFEPEYSPALYSFGGSESEYGESLIMQRNEGLDLRA